MSELSSALAGQTGPRPDSGLESLVVRLSRANPKQMEQQLAKHGLLLQSVQAAALPRLRIGDSTVLNFASALYLGHDLHAGMGRAVAWALRRWGFSLGMPRLYAGDVLIGLLETGIARWVGQEEAKVFPSTTHLALDVLPLLAGGNGVVFVDSRAYPISLDGAALAKRGGARLKRFPHGDLVALEDGLRLYKDNPDKAIVVDGVYSSGYEPARLDLFAGLARRYGAVIYVDDAHGLGVLGKSPSVIRPYGTGGGGSPAFFNLPAGNVLHAGSLSKAFGVPLAFAAGPRGFIDYLRLSAGSNLHCSPPAVPTIAAGISALQAHQVCGEELRMRLLRNVRCFRERLAQSGVRLSSKHDFPIQTLTFESVQDAWRAAIRLRRQGIWPVLQLDPPDRPAGGALRFILTADHTESDLDFAAGKVAAAIAA